MTVILHDKTSGEISALLEDLQQTHNLVANRDFEFAFSPSRWDPMIGDVPKKTQFTFANPVLESWFALAYQQNK